MKHSIKTLPKISGTKHMKANTVKHIKAYGIVKQTIVASASALVCASLLTILTLPIPITPAQAQEAEPTVPQVLGDFSVLPENLVGDITSNPNILIILDNSTSMSVFAVDDGNDNNNNSDNSSERAYVTDPVTRTRYLELPDDFRSTQTGERGRHVDASSSLSNSFQVRLAMRNILTNPRFIGQVNVGLMTFGTDVCTYDRLRNDANAADVAEDGIGRFADLSFNCGLTAANQTVGAAGAPEGGRRGQSRAATTGLGALRANVQLLSDDIRQGNTTSHQADLLNLLAPEPSVYINEANNGERNIGTLEGDTRPIIEYPPEINRSNPLHGRLHPFLDDDVNRTLTGLDIPILTNPRRSFPNSTPIAGALDSAFRYLLESDPAVDTRSGADANNPLASFNDGLIAREIRLANSDIQYPTLAQCQGDLIVILLTDGNAQQTVPTDLETGRGINDDDDGGDSITSATRLRQRGAASLDALPAGEEPIAIHVIGFNLTDVANANAIAVAGGTVAAQSTSSTAEVEAAFTAIFDAALGEVGSRSGLSVVSAENAAIGSVIQPSFVPLMTQAAIAGQPAEQVSWTGNIANFFIDEFGNFREDTNGDNILDTTDDGFLVQFDDITQRVHVVQFNVAADGAISNIRGQANDNNVADTPAENAFTPFIAVSDLIPIWSATERLRAVVTENNQVSASQNRVYTSSGNGRHILTSSNLTTDVGTSSSSGAIPFVWSNTATTQGIDPTNVGLFDLQLPSTPAAQTPNTATENLVDFIRGFEGVPGFRNRTLAGESFLLGDIVHSTPAQVEAPVLPQGNSPAVLASFGPYQERYIDRRRMVYVGANDGMLHAFNGGFWDGLDENDEGRPVSVTRQPTADSAEPAGATNFELGDEVWAYVPRAVFPHLKFLSDPNYLAGQHVAYVDGSLQSYEVKLFDDQTTGDCVVANGDTAPDSCHYVNGWGTILVAGLRSGGAPYRGDFDNDPTTADTTTAASYLVFDITDPEQAPVLISEISNPGFNIGTSTPTIVRTSVVPSDAPSIASPVITYALAIGSGPTSVQTATITDGISTPELFTYALSSSAANQTGNGAGFQVANGPVNTFVGGISTADWNGDDIDDAIYFGTVGGNNEAPTGQLYRGVLSDAGEINSTQLLIDAQGAVEQTPVIPADQLIRENKYILFGTGRIMVPADVQQDYLTANVFAGIIENIDTIDTNSVTFSNGVIAADLDANTILKTNTGADGNNANTSSSLVENVLPGQTRSDLLGEFGYDADDDFRGWVFELPLGQLDGGQSASAFTARISTEPATFAEFAFFSDFQPQTQDDAQDSIANGICLPPGESFLSVFDYRIGVVPSSERLQLSEDGGSLDPENAGTLGGNREELGSGIVGGLVFVPTGRDENGNETGKLKTANDDGTGGDFNVTALDPIGGFGRSAWREISIPE